MKKFQAVLGDIRKGGEENWVVDQFAIFRSAAVPAAAGGSGKAVEIFDMRFEFSCAAGEDTRAPVKLMRYRKLN